MARRAMIPGSALRPGVVVTAFGLGLLWGGCPGRSGALSPDLTISDSARDLGYLPPLFDAAMPDAFDPCAFDDGQSCAGGQACPRGLQPVREPDGTCSCRVPCVPGEPDQCGGPACDRVCVPKADAEGNPIPGAGICLPDPGQAQGEPCGPASCKQWLLCIGPDDDHAFCRRTCESASDCPGYKMVCGEVEGDGAGQLICVPGENPGGPGEGEDCSATGVYCNLGLICDPATRRCLRVCNTDGSGDNCSSGTCTRLVDSQVQVTLGYGCT